jgi:hypothetical protein
VFPKSNLFAVCALKSSRALPAIGRALVSASRVKPFPSAKHVFVNTRHGKQREAIVHGLFSFLALYSEISNLAPDSRWRVVQNNMLSQCPGLLALDLNPVFEKAISLARTRIRAAVLVRGWSLLSSSDGAQRAA